MIPGPPGDEFGHSQCPNVLRALLGDQGVDGDQIGGGETQLGEEQVDPVQSEGEFALEQAEVGLLQAGSVADDKAALAPVTVTHAGQVPLALPQPAIEERGGLMASPVVPPPVGAGERSPEPAGN